MIQDLLCTVRQSPFVKFILLWLIALAAPIPSFAATFQKSYPMKVAATVGMVADIVREVAGDKAEVKNIIGSGVDPHVYNPTRGDVAILLKSDIIFYAGLLLNFKMLFLLTGICQFRISVGQFKAGNIQLSALRKPRILRFQGSH